MRVAKAHNRGVTSQSPFLVAVLNDFTRDWHAGLHVLTTYLESDFNWYRGSTLIFWRWEKSLPPYARDGFHPFQWG